MIVVLFLGKAIFSILTNKFKILGTDVSSLYCTNYFLINCSKSGDYFQ